MAILQISRITQRKGLAQDLPQPLAGAELGWAVDERKLYIGNGDLADGAPIVGNTEILTEFSDLLSYTTAYTYKGAAAGYTVQTGATSGAPVTQSLQSRLDSYAIVTDFGAKGDGVTDDTAAINRALYQLFCRQTNTQVRRSLFFPAGTYLITDTILVPPFAKLYGEGALSSVIKFQVNPWVSFTPYSAGTMVYYATTGLYYRAVSQVPVDDPASPGNAILPTDTTYWDQQSLPEYIATTADSLQQTGASIGTNGAAVPQNVEIASMGFVTANSGTGAVDHNIWLVDRATGVSFSDVGFQGPFTTADGSVATQDLACVRFGSSPSLPCTQVNFDNCQFSGATYGIWTNQDVKGSTVSNSLFSVLYRGVVLENDPIGGTSPTGVRLVENVFDVIYNEAIVFSGASLNASAYNVFYDVGNIFLNVITTPVIDIDADNNISIGDMFARSTAEAATQPRIRLNDSGSVALGMNIRGITYNIAGNEISNQMQLGTYTRATGVVADLIDNSTNNLFTVDTGLSNPIVAFRVDYTIIRSTAYRTGTMTITSNTPLTYTDDYTENASTGITLSASQTGSNVTVSYTSTSTGGDGTIRYSITHLS